MSNTRTHRPSTAATVLALISVTLLGGCNRTAEPAGEPAPGQQVRPAAAAQAGSAAAPSKRDAAITTEVTARMSRDPQLSNLNIEVASSGGNVVLRGSVPDTSSRALATEVARAVDQVVGVDNQMNVQPRK
jgi:hypothetical protein